MEKTNNGFEINVGVVGCGGKHTVVDSILSSSFRQSILKVRGQDESPVIVCYKVNVESDKENEGPREPEIESERTITIDDKEIREMVFSVNVKAQVVPMRCDTQLVFTVLPRSTDLLAQKWGTFDAVIVVMDGKKGMQEEDVALLKLVKDHQGKYEIPLIFLCNKIDDTDDEKLARHVEKARSKFKKVLDIQEADQRPYHFCPISALNASIYRAGALMTVVQFNNFDSDLVELVGMQHFGSKKWKKMSEQERSNETHSIITEPSHFKDAMKEYGFDKAIKSLETVLGTEHTQVKLIRKKMQNELDSMSPFQSDWIAYTIFDSYQKHRKLLTGEETADELVEHEQVLRDAFWTTFQKYQDGNFEKFMASFPMKVSLVSDILTELIYYKCGLVDKAKWDNEADKIREAMIALVRRYLTFLVRRERETNGNLVWSPKHGISPVDWSIIWRSILLMSYNKHFCELFGKEKIICEGLHLSMNEWAKNGYTGFDQYCSYCSGQVEVTKNGDPRCKSCTVIFMKPGQLSAKTKCRYCGNGKIGSEYRCGNCHYLHAEFPDFEKWLTFSYDENLQLVPADLENYQKIVHLQVPTSLEDSNHYAHPIYKVCNFFDENQICKIAKPEVETKQD